MGLPSNIILVGFMGSGKTSTGQDLASRLGFGFVDMDRVIEDREGMTIPEFFETRGEPAFRERERLLTGELVQGHRQVIAIGGGAWMEAANREKFLKGGWCVWLKVSALVAWERVRHHLKDRPLLARSEDPLATIRGLLAQREKVYALAPVHLQTDHLPPETVAKAIVERLREERPFDLPELQA